MTSELSGEISEILFFASIRKLRLTSELRGEISETLASEILKLLKLVSVLSELRLETFLAEIDKTFKCVNSDLAPFSISMLRKGFENNFKTILSRNIGTSFN